MRKEAGSSSSSSRETAVGEFVVRIRLTPGGFAVVLIKGANVVERLEGSDPDALWQRGLDAATRRNPNFFGYDGARNRFLRFFPRGFNDEDFVKEERAYKLNAKAKLDAAANLDTVLLSPAGSGKAALAAFRATNLLPSFEKTRLEAALRGPHADAFVAGAAQFAAGDRKGGLSIMEKALRHYDVARWTAATYLPFLWRPNREMFLKPTVTRKFAERVGHRFATRYEARLDASVYEDLIELVSELRDDIFDMEPQDNIDLQSFIWVAGEYTFEDEAAL